jgi:hypothetical protein
MPVAFVILAFFVWAFFGLLTMALACAAHDREEFPRVDASPHAREEFLRVDASPQARRPVVDRRYIEVELARGQRLRSRAGWVGGSSSVASLAPH